MKRLMLTLMAVMAVAAAAGPLPGDTPAAAKDGRDGRWEQRAERGDRGGAREFRVQRRDDGPGRGRGQGRGQGRDEARGGEWRDGPRRDYRDYDGPPRMRRDDYGPPPMVRDYGPPARRGGYMPPQYRREGAVEDYGRYRLRAPPRGYTWVRVGAGYALVSTQTGQVFDVVPD